MGFNGERLKQLRNGKKMTQEHLANRLNLVRPAVAMWEIGRNAPTVDMVAELADIFDCSTDYLLDRTDDATPITSSSRLMGNFELPRIPLLGSVAAGEPIYDKEIGVYVDGPVKADAALIVKGDSMAPNYLDGDVVYIKCCPDVPEGAVAVVLMDDEAALKHVYKRPEGLTLWSDNPAYPPYQVNFEDYPALRIFGVPVGYTRMYQPEPLKKLKKGMRK